MHIQRQTATDLVLQDGSRWLAFPFYLVSIALIATFLKDFDPVGLLCGTMFSFVAALFTRHTEFAFDRTQRLVRWRRRTFLKNDSGSIPFDAIRDIVIDAQRGSRGATSYRLSVLTVDGPTPMSNSVGGGDIERYQHLRQQILDFIGIDSTSRTFGSGAISVGQHGDWSSQLTPSDGVPADIEPSLCALLTHGRTIDAIKLLQSRDDRGLADAKHRIDALRNKMKEPS